MQGLICVLTAGPPENTIAEIVVEYQTGIALALFVYVCRFNFTSGAWFKTALCFDRVANMPPSSGSKRKSTDGGAKAKVARKGSIKEEAGQEPATVGQRLLEFCGPMVLQSG